MFESFTWKKMVLTGIFTTLAGGWILQPLFEPRYKPAVHPDVDVSTTVAGCQMNARNGYDIVDNTAPGSRYLYRMQNGAVDDAIDATGHLTRQTIIGMTEPRFPTDPPVKMTVDPQARSCTLPGFVYALK